MKKVVYFLVFIIIYLLALYINQKIIWILYLLFLMLMVFSRQKFVYKPIVPIFLLIFPLVWTICLSTDFGFYSNIQGLFYLSVPIIMISIGYQIAKILTLRQILTFLVSTGTFLSIVYISIVLFTAGFGAFLAPYAEARFVVGSGSPASILSLVITSYSQQYGFKIFRNNIERYVFVIINLMAIYLFASRTYWFVLIIFLLLFNLKFILKNKGFIILLSCTGVLFLILFPVRLSGDIVTTKSLIFKMIKTFSEIKFSDYKTYSEINIHYRGYEAYRAFMTYAEGNPINLLFGHGLGQAIELKASVYLAGLYRSVIPWIHNGYFFILVKEGALGLVGLLLFFLEMLKIGYRNLEKTYTEKRFMSLMILGCIFSLIVTNYVICSMFTIEMAIILITIGVLVQILYVGERGGVNNNKNAGQ